MELVYLWVEKFGGISNMEIAFTKDYEFLWVGKELKVFKSQNSLPPNFFGSERLNVNAIVGRNDSGKSAALKCITRFFGNFTTKSVIGVVSSEKKLTIYHPQDLDIVIKSSDLYEVKSHVELDLNMRKILRIPKIYYSQTFDLKTDWEPFGGIDISTTQLLKQHLRKDSKGLHLNLYDSFVAEEFKHQLRLTQNKKDNFRFDFEEKLKAIGIYHDFHYSIDGTSAFKYLSGFKILKTISNEISKYHLDATRRKKVGNINVGKVVLILIILDERLSIDSLVESYPIISEKTKRSRFGDLIKLDELKDEKSISGFLNMMSVLLEEFPYEKHSRPQYNSNYEQMRMLEFDPDLMMIRFVLDDLNENNLSVSVPGVDLELIHQLEMMEFEISVDIAGVFLWILERLEVFLRPFDEKSNTRILDQPVFSYHWYLSTGALSAFTLYSRLINAKIHNKELNESDTVWLCLDEAEASYNPEWQRKFVKQLLDFIPILFPEQKVQIFLATHSPIILSDIPRCNIAFLKSADSSNQEQNTIQETFGANIHTLYSKGFFLDSLIGEFAKKKIQSVIDRLKNIEEQDIEDIKKHIDLIGEPILKNQLQKMLNTKRKSEVDVLKDQVKDLQERLKRLEGGTND